MVLTKQVREVPHVHATLNAAVAGGWSAGPEPDGWDSVTPVRNGFDITAGADIWHQDHCSHADRRYARALESEQTSRRIELL